MPLSSHDSRRDISLGRANHRWRGECKNTSLVSFICLRVLLTADYVYHDGWVLYFVASWQNLCSDIHNALIHLHLVNILSNNSLLILTTISHHRTRLPDRLIVPIIRRLLRQLNCKLIDALSCLSLHKVCRGARISSYHGHFNEVNLLELWHRADSVHNLIIVHRAS